MERMHQERWGLASTTAFALLELLRPYAFVEIKMTWILHSILRFNFIYPLVSPSFWKMTLFLDFIVIVSWVSFQRFCFQHKKEKLIHDSLTIKTSCQTYIIYLCNWSPYYLQGVFPPVWEPVSNKHKEQQRRKGRKPGPATPIMLNLHLMNLLSGRRGKLNFSPVLLFSAFSSSFLRFFFLWDRVLLCSSSCPRTLYADQSGFKIREIHWLLPLECCN